MCDQLYWSPAKLKKHTDDLGSFFGALGFTSLTEQLALRVVPAESLLTWLTTLTGPHLMEAVVTSESHTALAILVTPEELYDYHSPRVGLGLVYKAPYIKTASFSEAFFHLKSASDAEADKRITELNLMFVGINEASKVIPLPYIQPLFLDVPTMSAVTDSKKPWSPHAFRAFRLHRVIYAEGSTLRTQVAYPHLGGTTKSHLLNFQKQQLIPELCEHSMVSAALTEADDGHRNVTNDPIYLASLEAFRRRHESSQAPQANKSAEGSGTGGGSPTGAMTPPSTTSSQPLLNKDKASPLNAVILLEMDFQYKREYVIHKLHKSKSLNQISISYDTNQRKQITFCPYCGVINENTATALSHARKHLRIAFLCGGCYCKIYKKPQLLYNHMLSCWPTVIHRKEKDSQKSEGEGQ